MNVLIVGCGKLGARLAEVFCHHGHNVSIVDRNKESFNLLSEDFDGMTIVGMPMDLEILRSAGVEGCDAVAVVTPDDNLNITVSQIVKEFFGVENVVARIIDPARQKVFRHFGLKTTCQTTLTCDAIFSVITHNDDERQLTFGTSTLGFTLRNVDSMMIGRTVDVVPIRPGEIIVGVMDEDKHVKICDGRKKIVLNPKDKLIYAKISE